MTMLFFLIASMPGLLYVAWIIFLYYGLKKTLNQQFSVVSKDKMPFVSVIIPARNEEQNIISLLNDLLVQDAGMMNFEVIVVDDHSEDRTATLVADFAAQHPELKLLLIAASNISSRPKKDAIRDAVAIAHGDLLLTTDADCRLGPSWISGMASNFKEQSIDFLAGPVIYFPLRNFFERMQALEFLSLIGSALAMAGLGKPIMSNGANLAFTRNAFYALNDGTTLHAKASGDDIELMMAVKKSNPSRIRFISHAACLVSTHPESGLVTLMQQRIRWASKAKSGYDAWNTITALWVFMYQCAIIVLCVVGFFFPMAWMAAGMLFIVKALADLPFLYAITKQFKQSALLWTYLPLQLLYPWYIVIVAVIALGGRYQWKNRRYRGQ